MARYLDSDSDDEYQQPYVAYDVKYRVSYLYIYFWLVFDNFTYIYIHLMKKCKKN